MVAAVSPGGTPDEVCRNPLVLEAYLGRLSLTA